MAGDWIKMEMTTPDKPEVVAIAAALRIDQDAVLGKLFRIWAWADQNSVDGEMMPVTAAFIDRLTNKKGFAAAMRNAGWLEGDDGALCFPNFGRHNGATAKSRALDNRRKSDWRERGQMSGKCPDENRTKSGSDRLKNHGPEKRREEKNISLPLPLSDTLGDASAGGERDFCREKEARTEEPWPERIVAAYPVTGNRKTALEAVRSALAGGANPAEMLAAVGVHAAKFRALPASERRFCPGLHTYFEGGRWRDDPNASPWKKPGSREVKAATATAKKAPEMKPVRPEERATAEDIRAAKEMLSA